MAKIGFSGLGIMGLPMAANLAKKCGSPVTGFDITPERRDLFAKRGGKTAADPAALYAESDIIFLCLPTTEALQTSVEQILQTAKPGTIIVDLGSSAPNAVRDLYAKAKAKNMRLLDSPVSGGETGAIAGTLVMMCGGDKDVFETIKPFLLCMGSNATFMGGTGNGSVAKLANNMMVGIHLSAIGEAFAYAVKAGLDPQALFDAIKDGYAGSFLLSLKLPNILKRDFVAGGRVSVHQKDLRNAVKLAEEMGVKIPMSEMALGYLNELEKMGRIGEDHSAIARIYERDMGVEIKRQG